MNRTRDSIVDRLPGVSSLWGGKRRGSSLGRRSGREKKVNVQGRLVWMKERTYSPL